MSFMEFEKVLFCRGVFMNQFGVLFGSGTASVVYLLKREVVDSSVFSIRNFNLFPGNVSYLLNTCV